jgi:hypothetical protein
MSGRISLTNYSGTQRYAFSESAPDKDCDELITDFPGGLTGAAGGCLPIALKKHLD